MKIWILSILLSHTLLSTEVPREIRLDGMAMRLIKISPQLAGVELADFYALETEVTNAQFSIFLKETGRVKMNPQLADLDENDLDQGDFIWDGDNYPKGMGNHPVVFITVKESKLFCKWLTKRCPMLAGRFRLPTLAEWQFAAYGKNRKYPWGNEIRANAYFNKNILNFKKYRATNPVKAYEIGKTPEGLHGMWGNVNEMVTIVAEDPNHPLMDTLWMGGSFMDEKLFSPKQKYWGYAHGRDFRSAKVGFRIIFQK